MKYLCPGCDRLVTAGAVRVDADRVVVECPTCGAEDFLDLDRLDRGAGAVARPAGPRAERPEPAAGASCPKCGQPRGDDDACPICGLVYSKWLPGVEPGPPRVAADLWRRLETRWDDDALHQRFLAVCLEGEALSYAARCYRSRDDEIARRQLDRLTTLGVQAMQIAEQPGRFNPRVFRIVGWAFFFALCVTIIVVIFSYR